MTNSEDDDQLMISAIEHYAYCPRQFALIHIEQAFEENVFTLQGQAIHARADTTVTTWEEGKRVERALPLWSDRLGLTGRADTVEFYADGKVVPVEYKRGARRPRNPDDMQLCAQALCLEEMLGVHIEEGAIFSHGSRHSRTVSFDEELRRRTLMMIEEMRELLREGRTPLPVNDQRCRDCSLKEICQPDLISSAVACEASPEDEE